MDPPAPPQTLANWIVADLLARLGDIEGAGGDPSHSLVTPAALATLCGLVAAKRVSVGAARQVLDRLVADGGDPLAIVEAEGLEALDGGDELAGVVAAAHRRQRGRRRRRSAPATPRRSARSSAT